MLRYSIVFVVLVLSCSSPEQVEQTTPKLFLKLSSGETGIDFENTLTTREDFDVFRYRNFYNGGGVGIADFNNDGLADVFLTSNMGDNKLYLNTGDWKFQDITEKAGVRGSKVWSTGVSIADVNGDGLLDIYVSNAGDVKGGHRENELFINNGDLTFTDKAY
jgi:enediyne biosynthesis protein E4